MTQCFQKKKKNENRNSEQITCDSQLLATGAEAKAKNIPVFRAFSHTPGKPSQNNNDIVPRTNTIVTIVTIQHHTIYPYFRQQRTREYRLMIRTALCTSLTFVQHY